MTNICLLWKNTSFVATEVCLFQQKFCRDKIMFVVTKLLLPQISVMTNTRFSQQNFCHNKHTFLSWKSHVLAWQTCVCRDKSILTMTKLLLWPDYVCRDKYLSPQHFCCDNNILSRQAYFCCDKHVCRDKNNKLWQLLPMIGKYLSCYDQRREMRKYYDDYNQSSGRIRKILWLLWLC